MIDALYTAAAPALRAWIDGNHARVVAVSQRVDKRRGGGSTMPALDAAHAAVLQAFRIEARNPYRAPRLDFGPVTVRGMMRRWGFPDDVTYAVVHKDTPGMAQPPRFHHPAQIKAVRDTLVAEGLIEPDETDTYGRVKAWTYAGRIPGTLDRGPSGRMTPAIAHAEAGAKEVGTQFYKAALAKLVAELAPVRA